MAVGTALAVARVPAEASVVGEGEVPTVLMGVGVIGLGEAFGAAENAEGERLVDATCGESVRSTRAGTDSRVPAAEGTSGSTDGAGPGAWIRAAADGWSVAFFEDL